MISKPLLLVRENETVFQTPWFCDMWQDYFDIEIINLDKSYDNRNTLVIADWTSSFLGNQYLEKSKALHADIKTLIDRGMRWVIDHSWDSWDSRLDNVADFTLRPRDFIRVNESIWYKHLGYDKFELTSDPTRDFLLLMNVKMPHRTKLYDRLTPVLKDNIYSYNEYGIPLQNAQDQEFNTITWQRYIDPAWYASTRFSIVSESMVHARDKVNSQNTINVTEKTLKPCAFKHPYIVWGQAGTLAWQKRQGFETFEHCIDESYDTVEDADIRFEKVVEQIDRCIADKTIFADPLTKQKLEHNYNHFYNEEVVMKLFKEQMIDPLLEFIES
jgi:hypothetical protein